MVGNEVVQLRQPMAVQNKPCRFSSSASATRAGTLLTGAAGKAWVWISNIDVSAGKCGVDNIPINDQPTEFEFVKTEKGITSCEHVVLVCLTPVAGPVMTPT